MEILQNFVAFSEYMNFILVSRLSSKRTVRLFFPENLDFCQTSYFDSFDVKIPKHNQKKHLNRHMVKLADLKKFIETSSVVLAEDSFSIM